MAKKTNKEVEAFNKKLEEEAKALREADIPAEVIDQPEYVPLTTEQSESIKNLREELEGTSEPITKGRLDDVINDFNSGDDSGRED